MFGEGELSTKFLHMMVVVNRRRNIIESITVNGLVFQKEEVKEAIVIFYEHLFNEMVRGQNKGLFDHTRKGKWEPFESVIWEEEVSKHVE